ncbi:hypothetical protein V2G26_018058 [Clonostachys chloroleuca]|uniref:Prefoldin subunit 6 n=1 Tax=Clonostachys chloroleuca TaxID=1926264 RepID=A0AA35MA66_9HYPO|nr:unnamed protein product [Clonostachys chloroleuca]
MASADSQARLQALTDEFQKLQQDLQTTVAARQKLEGQKQENTGVKNEFASMDEEETIYKLVGPVLLKQEKQEAVSTINGRLDFIDKEIARLEGVLKEQQESAEKKKMEIIQVQSAAQSTAAEAGKGQ